MVLKPRLYFPRLSKSKWPLSSQVDTNRLCHASSTISSARRRVIEPYAFSIFSNSTSALIKQWRPFPGTLTAKPPHTEWNSVGGHENKLLLVILLTTKHISLLDKPVENIGAYLNAIYPGAQDEARHVDVVTAVVDRIPTASVDQEWSATTEALNGGREGLSVAYLESSDAAPDLWESHPVVTEDITMSIQQQCSISFALRQNKNPRSWQKVQLPVANTLFLNGRTSTLLAQSWVKHPLRGQDETNSFNLVEERTLQEQVINLTSSSHPNDWHMESELNSALTPITKPREVAAAVGNIVQKMYVEDNLKALPASQELEGAIQSIIQKGETPAAYIEVWALITPKGLEKSYAKITHDALQSGCQLRKVLSGGGGWGVKQGLLSLDPDAAYGSSVTDPHVLRSSPDSIDQVTSEDSLLFKNENISPQEFLEDESPNIFENLVKPGDIITFFVNKIPEGPSFEPIASDGFLTSGPNVALPITLQFGTLPSTIDAPPATVDERSETESKTPVSIVRSHFGMLSEQGMSFEGPINSSSKSFNPSPNLSEERGTERLLDKVKLERRRTKLDAPYTSLTYRFGHRKNFNL